jgi:hypothetical protein
MLTQYYIISNYVRQLSFIYNKIARKTATAKMVPWQVVDRIPEDSWFHSRQRIEIFFLFPRFQTGFRGTPRPLFPWPRRALFLRDETLGA